MFVILTSTVVVAEIGRRGRAESRGDGWGFLVAEVASVASIGRRAIIASPAETTHPDPDLGDWAETPRAGPPDRRRLAQSGSRHFRTV
jgi:hypothetical protein